MVPGLADLLIGQARHHIAFLRELIRRTRISPLPISDLTVAHSEGHN